MALLYASGFENFDSSGDRTELDSNWDFTFHLSASDAGMETPGRVGGRRAFVVENSVSTITAPGILLPVSGFSTDSTWILGYSYEFSGINYLGEGATKRTNAIFQFIDSESDEMLTIYARGGTITVRRGSDTGTVLGVAAANFHSNVNQFVECKVAFHDTTGSVTIRVHEQEVLALTNVDTMGTTATAPTQIKFAAASNASELSGSKAYIDDVYICDGTDGTASQGRAYNDFLGDNGLKRLNPTSDGSSTDFTLSAGSDSFALVDDDPPDDDTTYIESQTANHVTLFGFGNLSDTPQQVEAVIVTSKAKKTDSGSRTFTHRVLSSTTGDDGDAIAPGTDYQWHQSIFGNDPDASDRWDETSINALEAGVKVVS